jgi:large subunit ribosomal protein L24|uniref:Large ribosomal subunit protein uL24 n=1 Tax=Desulfobacca acetoxidans TaxID=60893 RepID=A0A7C5EL77_9BACT
MPRAKKKPIIPVPIRLKKNDLVEVRSGREAGKTGKILKVIREKNQVVVEKVNIIKRHTRPSPTTGQGGIIEKEAPLHVSKVMLICPKCAHAGRFRVTVTGEGKKSRVCRKCKELIDG